MKRLALALCLLAGQSSAAVTVSGTPSGTGTGSGVTSLVFSHTTGAGTNLATVVNATAVYCPSGNPITSVTANGLTFTQYQNTNNAISGAPCVAKMGSFYLLAPPASTTLTITVTYGSNGGAGASAITFAGVNQTTPLAGYLEVNGGVGTTVLASTITPANTGGAVLLFGVDETAPTTFDAQLTSAADVARIALAYILGTTPILYSFTNTYMPSVYRQAVMEVVPAAPVAANQPLSPYHSNDHSNRMAPIGRP